MLGFLVSIPQVRSGGQSDRSDRIRIRDHRVVFEIFSWIVTIEIVRIGHPQSIYKKQVDLYCGRWDIAVSSSEINFFKSAFL